eukprot:Tbor_TRINITY_DN4416_c0_g1::TRINITY_DN4416_c0_g1_i1::g.7958::m.7958
MSNLQVSFTDIPSSLSTFRFSPSRSLIEKPFTSKSSSTSSRKFSVESESTNLKNRIRELEDSISRLENENEGLNDLKKEIESLQQENNITNRNCDILQGNVETLKALSNQLALQLKESKARTRTLEYRLSSESIRKEIESTADIDAIKNDHIKRTSEMEKAMQRSQKANEEIAAKWEEREIIQDLRIRNLEKAKDDVISKLREENKALKTALESIAVPHNNTKCRATVRDTRQSRTRTHVVRHEPQLYNHSKTVTSNKSTKVLNFAILSKDLIAEHEESLSSATSLQTQWHRGMGFHGPRTIPQKYNVDVEENAAHLVPVCADHYTAMREENKSDVHTRSWAYLLDEEIFACITFETFRRMCE